MDANEGVKERTARRKRPVSGEKKAQTEAHLPVGLDEEIGILRDIIRRVVVQGGAGLELAELMGMLDTVGKASTRLATLLKAQRALGEGEGLAASIDQALAQVIRELKDEG